ncbi:sigma-54-dependent Fis family transcriptional regulator [Gordonia paraffinivorans]|uniref:sigma-54-dependent Fis family transcriptional regulator n=1 Tax=Gordonia paraffinivorans TaxID=175628 RepID=UPI0014461759|nr:helix-turn-helix domain-containing protein [Gordonia paraffinivorans]
MVRGTTDDMGHRRGDGAGVGRALDALRASGLTSRLPSDVSVSREIENSWRRSIAVAADRSGEFRYVNQFDADSMLLRAAGPVLDRWQDRLADTKLVLFVADRSGQIVDRRATDTAPETLYDRYSCAVGFDFGEDTIGTNGLGAPLASKRPLLVRGEEHYHQRLDIFTCAGAPIIHPFLFRPMGAFALASKAERARDLQPLLLSMAAEIAEQIRERVESMVSSRDLALTLSNLKRRSPRHPVIVLDQDSVMANVRGLAIMSPEVHASLWEQLCAHQWTAENPVADIDSPLIKGRVTARRLDLGDGPAFSIEVEPVPSVSRRCGAEPTPTGDDAAAGNSPMRHSDRIGVAARIDAAVRTGSIVALVGPQGSGKATAALEWVEKNCGFGAALVLDAAVADDQQGSFYATVRSALVDHPYVVIRHAEYLATDVYRRLHAFLDAFVDEPRVATGDLGRLILTVDRGRADGDLVEIVEASAEIIEVAGLAQCREAIPELVREILDGLGGERVRFSSPAMQALLRWEWPGNISELRRLLTQLSSEHPGELIELEDLPDRMLSVGRNLTKMQELERDAIVQALAQAGGNRSSAAELLGIGRTTLYRKMRALGIAQSERLRF